MRGSDTDAGNVTCFETRGNKQLMGGNEDTEYEGANEKKNQSAPPTGFLGRKTATEDVEKHPAKPEKGCTKIIAVIGGHRLADSITTDAAGSAKV